MGLLDVLTGMRNGPRGGSSGAGGMSPITMALLGLLAYKAVKGFSASAIPPGPPGKPGEAPTGAGVGLGDILDWLGMGNSPLARGLGASGLSGGLGDLLKQFQGAGKTDVAESWVSTGQNKQVAAEELSEVLSEDQIAFLMEKTGLSREDLLRGLADELPNAVNELTPAGRLPSSGEIDKAI
ncbi:YidB family protein [Reyranella sp.]|uniref:YidB family protein n=1 Tax=Reyranella sp. TaxID=1929291 RepID=UPI003BAA4506